HFLHDIFAGLRTDFGWGKIFGNRANTIRYGAITLAEAQQLEHGRQVHYVMLFVQRHGDSALSAKNALLAKMVIEDIQLKHAVEQRNDYRPRSHGRRKRTDRTGKVECLAAQQHDIEWFFERVRL